MADDFDDDKDGKDDKGKKKDHLGFAQFENAINEVKSQMRSTNPAELARLNASISSLLSSDLPPEMLAKLKDLLSTITEKEEHAEQVILSQQLNEAREAEAARLASFLEMEAKEAVRLEQIHQESSRLEPQHEEFKEDIDKCLATIKDENAQLDDIIKDLEKDGDVDPNKLAALIKTEDQIKKENEEYKKLNKHRDEIHKHYNEVSTHHQGLLTEKTRLGNELTEKEKTEKPQSPTILNTKAQIKRQDKKIKEFEPVLAKVTEQKKEVDAAFRELENIQKQSDIKLEEIHKKIDKSEDITLEKRKMLNQFATLFPNQQEAIVDDGIVKDTLLRSEFIEQLKNEQDVAPELENSKTQKESTNTNKEQDKSPITVPNNLPGDAIHNKGNKVIERLGYPDHIVIMNQPQGVKLAQHATKELSDQLGHLKSPLTPSDPNKNKGREK